MRSITLCWYLIIAVSAAFLPFNSLQAGDDLSWAIPGDTVYDDELYVKIKSKYSPLDTKVYDGIVQTGINSIDNIAVAFGIYEFRKSFVIIDKVRGNPRAADLDRWYTIRFPNAFDVFDVLAALANCTEVDIAEVSTINRKIYTPDDELLRSQWYIEKCDLTTAWDVSHGSGEIVIGIIDDGLDMNVEGEGSLVIHEDFLANIWVNPGEDIDGDGEITIDDWDGEDNDDNGYVDDFHGWDFGSRDNWPDHYHDTDGHGSHVAGLASAVTDNEEGIASAGFSCKIMVAAAYDRGNPNNVRYGYEGITYCASNGADIVNLSWGRDQGRSVRSREVIEFALGEGVAIFAGAGNDEVDDHVNRNTHFYPCAYDGVIGVGASTQGDNKAGFSNYGDYIDLVAPGVSMLSTYPRGTYETLQGTSMSSPFAAGIAALMLSVKPDLDAEELLAVMQETSVDILDEDGFAGIQYRVDAGNLLSTTHPLFELLEWDIYEWNGNQNGRAEPGEIVTLIFTLRNKPGHEDAHRVTFHLENDDSTVTITNADQQYGTLSGGEVWEIERNNSLTFRVHRSQPHYSTFYLTIDSEEGWPSVFEINMTLGQPYYLLMDDDGGEDIETYFMDDLAENSYVYDTWSMEENSAPTQEWLNSFDYLLWETGNARDPLSDDDQELIQNFLDNDGNLLLIGQFIGDDHGESDFFADYLHSRHLEDDVDNPQIEGVDGHPLTDGLNFLLLGGAAAGNNTSPSSVEPLEGAETIFTYVGRENAAGIYYWNGSYQVIYLGFALEAAAGAGRTTTRAEFIHLAFQRLFEVGVYDGSAPILPVDFSISQPYPNPFNATTVMQLMIPAADNIRLEAIDINGRQVDILHSGWLTSGTHNFSWNAAEQPAGVYFMRFNWSGGTQARRIVLLK